MISLYIHFTGGVMVSKKIRGKAVKKTTDTNKYLKYSQVGNQSMKTQEKINREARERNSAKQPAIKEPTDK